MTTPLLFATDTQSNNAFAPTPTSDLQSVQLTASTPVTITIPQNINTGKLIVSIKSTPGSEVWVDFTGNAAVLPSGTVSTTTSEMNISPRYINSKRYDQNTGTYIASTFSIITPNSSVNVSIGYWTAGQSPGN